MIIHHLHELDELAAVAEVLVMTVAAVTGAQMICTVMHHLLYVQEETSEVIALLVVITRVHTDVEDDHLPHGVIVVDVACQDHHLQEDPEEEVIMAEEPDAEDSVEVV